MIIVYRTEISGKKRTVYIMKDPLHVPFNFVLTLGVLGFWGFGVLGFWGY